MGAPRISVFAFALSEDYLNFGVKRKSFSKNLTSSRTGFRRTTRDTRDAILGCLKMPPFVLGAFHSGKAWTLRFGGGVLPAATSPWPRYSMGQWDT